MKYLAIFEKASKRNYSGYIPDLPGCIATGKTIEECRKQLTLAVHSHLELLHDHGEKTPRSFAKARLIEAHA